MPSAPFAARELNGETLLEELEGLRQGGVSNDALDECALALSHLRLDRAAEVAGAVRKVAASRTRCPHALAELLSSWAGKVRLDDDVPLFVSHVQRLALVAALIPALVKGSDRLRRGGKA